MLAKNHAYTNESTLDFSMDQSRTEHAAGSAELPSEASNSSFVDFHNCGQEIESVVVLSVN